THTLLVLLRYIWLVSSFLAHRTLRTAIICRKLPAYRALCAALTTVKLPTCRTLRTAFGTIEFPALWALTTIIITLLKATILLEVASAWLATKVPALLPLKVAATTKATATATETTCRLFFSTCHQRLATTTCEVTEYLLSHSRRRSDESEHIKHTDILY